MYSGSGLVIHLLARFQRTPILSSVALMVSALTIRSFVVVVVVVVSPSSKLTCGAASASVHKLVGLPKSLGLRWTISRSASVVFPSSGKAA